MAARLKQRYQKEVGPAIAKEFGIKNPMAIPRLEKIVINMGMGEAIANAKILDTAAEEIEHKEVVFRLLARVSRSRLLRAFGLFASDLGTWVRHRHDPEYRTLGASGAITAVLFASIIYFPTGSIFILPIPVPIPSPLFALGYLAYTWYASRRQDGRINHDAHLSGALAGVAFVALTDGAAIDRAWRQVFG